MERGLRLILGSILIASVLSANAQPKVVDNIPGHARNFIQGAQEVYFTAGDALWRTDGTVEGTFQLRTGLSNAGRLTSGSEYARMHGGRLYFVDGDATELWASDGSPEGTVLVFTASSIRILDGNDQTLFFCAATPETGVELYGTTDGDPAVTMLLKDIWPGPESGIDINGRYASTDLQFFFAANDGVHGREPWVSDGTAAGTFMLKDINEGPGDGFSLATNTYAHNGRFYFAAEEDEDLYPWVTDGSESGTVRLGDPAPNYQYATPYIEYLINHEDDVYFIHRPQEHNDGGTLLWKTAGTPETTAFIKLIGDEFSHNVLHSFRVYNDKVYFWNRVERVSDFLWVTDGTSAGTNTFFSLITIDGGINFFEVIGDYLVFTGDAEGIPYNIYRTDGTTTGTQMFARVKAVSYLVFPRGFTKASTYLFYADHDGLTDQLSGSPLATEDSYHLFEANGETSKSMRTLWGINTIDTDNITPLRDAIVFTAQHEGHKKWWFYDPSVRPMPEPTFTLVHASSDRDVRRIIDSASIVNKYEEQLSVRFDPVETPGSVVFRVNGSKVRTENAAPFSLAGDNNGDYNAWPQGTVPGTYVLTATSYSEANGQGAPGESLTVTFTISTTDDPVPVECTATGTILREYWANVSGTTVPAIPVNSPPTSTSELTLFEGPSNVGTNYGSRIRGYICPPVTGNYTFWISSNDHSELWLSTDDDPDNKVRIANLTRATNPREWNKFPSQQSEPIALVAGQRYYIEALHKQGIGGDHIAVGWQLPNGNLERPIAGSRLSPYVAEPPGCENAGSILREYWTNVQGARVSDIPLSNAPHGAEELTTFSTPSMGINYGSRIRGYICPPVSGEYVFWVSSNDHSELWLSNGEDSEVAQRIAWVTGATNPDQWNKFASQRSDPVHLEAGQLYYVEALHKQGIGTDHFAVAWTLPGGSFEAPIPGAHLVPFESASTMEASLSEASGYEQINVYPNPASSDQSQLTISGYSGFDESIETVVEIINLSGNIVFAEKVTCGGGCDEYLLSLDKQLNPGIYLINLKANGGRYSKRLIVK